MSKGVLTGLKQISLPVVWDIIADDDFVYRIGDYCLRVEQMDRKYWWWCVYYKDETIAFDDVRATTELEAKLLAEIAYLRHINLKQLYQ